MNKTVNATIEILGKFYPIRCQEADLKSLELAAKLLNEKMSEIKDSGKVINLERIAIITALNFANQLLQMHDQKTSFMDKINQRISQLQNKIDTAMTQSLQTELIYTAE